MSDKLSSDKKQSRTISLSESTWDMLQKIADKQYAGNRSAYLTSLIEQDIASVTAETEPLSPTVVQDLMGVLIGEVDAKDYAAMAASLNLDQVKELRELLSDYLLRTRVVNAGGHIRTKLGFELGPNAMFALAWKFMQHTGRTSYHVDELLSSWEKIEAAALPPPAEDNTISDSKSA